MKRFAALAGLLMALAACSSPPERGEVVGAKYEEPSTLWISGSCTFTGKTTVCTPGYFLDSPESWSLELLDKAAKKGNRGWREVTHDAFNRCPKGSHFPECAGGQS